MQVDVYFPYIAACYAIAFVVMLVLAFTSVRQLKKQQKLLRELEAELNEV